MAIPRRLLTALSKELDAYKLFASGSTTNSVLAWLDQVGAVASSDIPALRDVSIAAIEESMGMCQADVVSATLDAWDAATGANGLARAQAVSESMAGMAHEYADRKVRWLVGEVVDGRMTPIQFAKACGDMADRGVNHMHLAAMQAVSDRQGGKERWARVPSGSETCPFCIMLAGRGFVYQSAETAGGHYHVHCDCRVVKGVKGKTHVEGYDPDAIERRWRACADTIGLDPADAFDESGNPTKEILAEVATRDPKWLIAGKAIAPKFLERAKPDEYERAVAESLGRMGLGVTFRPEAPDFSTRQADSLINGQKWEFKNPAGSGRLTIWNQVKKCLYGRYGHTLNMQSSRLVISNARSSMTFESMISDLEKVLAREEGFEIADLEKMDEILILDVKTQRIRRFRT